jgi:hypothetical protein
MKHMAFIHMGPTPLSPTAARFQQKVILVTAFIQVQMPLSTTAA